MRALRHLLLACLLGAAWGALAQPPSSKQDEAPAAPPPAAQDGIQSQNIFDVKPEAKVKPDASSNANYMKQSNAERNRVQPGNNAPMWRDVQKGNEGFTSLPTDKYPEAGVLIQAPVQYPGSRFVTAGEAWRQVRNDWLVPYGGSLIVIWALAIAIFYFTRGRVGHHDAIGGGGMLIERFTPFERAAHWANAIAFSVLAISGLIMAFGKFFLLPVMGRTLYGPFTYVLKNLHNFFGPLFAVSLAIVILTFIIDERPRRGDLNWLLKLGGVFSKEGGEPPTERFNGGEKLLYWMGPVVLGVILVGSGLVMDKLIPTIDYVRSTMQVTHMVHLSAAVLMICVMGFHIYLGTLGMRGAYAAMRHGYVDEAWAQEHHGYWYEDIKAGRVPAQRSRPAEVPGDQVRPA